jgi:hypothetical protein
LGHSHAWPFIHPLDLQYGPVFTQSACVNPGNFLKKTGANRLKLMIALLSRPYYSNGHY